MQLRERAYERALRVGRALLGRGWGSAAVRRALAGRQTSLSRLIEWGEREAGAGPVVLVHAPSVGEALMAQAIIGELRRQRPDVRIAFTHFSPSAEGVAERVGADVWGYLPWDTRADSAALLDALRPRAVAFVRTEIWPVLGALAQQRGVRTVLLNAVLSAGSSRLSGPARWLLGPAYRRLDAVGAVAADDAARFAQLGVAGSRVRVTGDARFDQVIERIGRLDRRSPLLERLRSERLTLVAGSTWPADEAVLVPALGALAPGERPRLIVAPHQPTPAHLAGVEQTLRVAGLASRRLAEVEREGGPADVVVVDRVGVLADLYAIADLAYVGGGFGTAGLHSVVEPAALGVPVLYGPHHGNAREAGELAQAEGGVIVTRDTLATSLAELLRDAGQRARRGAAAAEFVRSRSGGAAANASLLAALLA